MARHRHLMSLVDLATGRQLAQDVVTKVVEAGGTAQVDAATTIDGAYTTNETLSHSDGKIEFFTPTTNNEVDIYYYTEHGYCGVIKNVKPGSVSEVAVDLNRLHQTMLYPFNAADSNFTANTNITTGVAFGDEVQILPYGMGVQVLTADATETMDIGVYSTSGVTDADGFVDALSIATAGLIMPAIGHTVGTNNVYLDLTGGDVEWTYGALMHPSGTKVAKGEGADAAATDGNGMYIFEPHVVDASSAANTEKLSYLLSTGSDTGAGIIIIPTLLPQPRL